MWQAQNHYRKTLINDFMKLWRMQIYKFMWSILIQTTRGVLLKWIILRILSTRWVAPIPKEGILSYGTMEESNWTQANKWACIHSFLFALDCGLIWLTIWYFCHDLCKMMDFNLKLWSEVNSFVSLIFF